MASLPDLPNQKTMMENRFADRPVICQSTKRAPQFFNVFRTPLVSFPQTCLSPQGGQNTANLRVCKGKPVIAAPAARPLVR
jgi:hypothetical protein